MPIKVLRVMPSTPQFGSTVDPILTSPPASARLRSRGELQAWVLSKVRLLQFIMAPHATFSTDAIADKARKDLLALLEGVSHTTSSVAPTNLES